MLCNWTLWRSLAKHFPARANFTWSACHIWLIFLCRPSLSPSPPMCFRRQGKCNMRQKKRNVRSCWVTFRLVQSESLPEMRVGVIEREKEKDQPSKWNNIHYFTSYFPISMLLLFPPPLHLRNICNCDFPCNRWVFPPVNSVACRWKDWSKSSYRLLIGHCTRWDENVTI